MYEVLVLSTLLYNAETWTMQEKQKQRLRVFEMACLRKIEGVTRRNRIRNDEIFNRLNIRIGIIDRIRNKRPRTLGNFWTPEYILPLSWRTLEYTPHPGRAYSRVRHNRVGRTLEYATSG